MYDKMTVQFFDMMDRRSQFDWRTELFCSCFQNVRFFDSVPPFAVRFFVKLSQEPSSSLRKLIQNDGVKSVFSALDRSGKTSRACSDNCYIIHLHFSVAPPIA